MWCPLALQPSFGSSHKKQHYVTNDPKTAAKETNHKPQPKVLHGKRDADLSKKKNRNFDLLILIIIIIIIKPLFIEGST